MEGDGGKEQERLVATIADWKYEVRSRKQR